MARIMSQIDYIFQSLDDALKLKAAIINDNKLIKVIETVANLCITALQGQQRIFFAGNGGSAADAQHLATELASRFMYDRPGLAALALTTNSSLLTAIGNDYGYDQIFSRQLVAHSRPGDIFIGISTSGNSPNILLAFERCRSLGVITVGLAGNSGKIQTQCDYLIAVPSQITPRIQEAHITIGHIICGLIENELFPRREIL